MRKLYIGIFATALMSGSALAHTPMIEPAPEPVISMAAYDKSAYDNSAFDWNGFYVGLGFGAAFWPLDTFPIVSGAIGYNFVLSDKIVAGVELNGLLYLNGTGDREVYLDGRLGVLATDSVLLYALAGVGIYNADFNDPLYNIGLGVEVAVTQNMSIRGEVRASDEFGNTPPEFFDASLMAVWNF